MSTKVLATWLERAHALGPLPGAYISVLEIDLSVEAQALLLTTVAEGLHRVLYPHTLRLSGRLASVESRPEKELSAALEN